MKKEVFKGYLVDIFDIAVKDALNIMKNADDNISRDAARRQNELQHGMYR